MWPFMPASPQQRALLANWAAKPLTNQDAELAYGWRADDIPPWATEDAQDQYLPPYSQLDAALAAPAPTPPEPREQNMTPQPQKTIRSLIDELKALKQRMQDEGAAGILQLLQDEVFSKYPEVKALAWTQYTPYYCDGESCVFGVNAYGTPRIRALSAAECDTIGLDFIVGEASLGPLDDIRAAVKNDASDSELMALVKCIKPTDSDEDEDEDEFDTDSYFTEDSGHGMRYDDARRGIDAIIDSVPDELMEIVFGDHVRVYACPTGIATAEYEHE